LLHLEQYVSTVTNVLYVCDCQDDLVYHIDNVNHVLV